MVSKLIPKRIPRFAMWSEKLVGKLSKKQYRDAYVADHVKRWIALQIRTLRESRNWPQQELGDQMGTPQSNISRIEDPDYGQMSLQTLFDLASAFDVALVVKFVDYRSFLVQSRNLSPEAMAADSFSSAAITPQQYPVDTDANIASAAPGRTIELADTTLPVLFVDADISESMLSAISQSMHLNASAPLSGYPQ